MKKILTFLLLILTLVSCSFKPETRTVNVEIPLHPWEKYEDADFWYNLCWSGFDEVNTLYVDKYTRALSIEIPNGETVCICAYPIGDMQCFGCVVTPLDTKDTFYLNQNDGYLADILLNLERDAVKNLNYPMLRQKIESLTSDFRKVDEQSLIKDILNGNLSLRSIKLNEKVTVPVFPCPGGIWISENVNDGRLSFTGNLSNEMYLLPGVHRFINREKNLELRIVVDTDGSIYHYERTPLVSF